MFTGLIEKVGEIKSNKVAAAGDLILSITTGKTFIKGVMLGDSIAVNGVCLTVVTLQESGFVADVSNESLAHTQLAQLSSGTSVNLEKALTLSTPLGGHLVSGHVDGLACITAIEKDSRSVRITLEAPEDLLRYMPAKGSICIDGVSLTINEQEQDTFTLNIVPHTAANTIIDGYKIGQQVHIEVDMLARYAERLLTPKTQSKPASRINEQFLAEHGFWK